MSRAIFYLFISTSLSFSQYAWGNGSIATSDHLNAFSFNPAGLAVDHGMLEGVFFKPDIDGKLNENGLIYLANVNNGFGFQQVIDKTTKLLKPHTYNSYKIGFGLNPASNLYMGLSIDSDKAATGGILYRPYKTLSLGSTY